jgi:hypothetical protein
MRRFERLALAAEDMDEMDTIFTNRLAAMETFLPGGIVAGDITATVWYFIHSARLTQLANKYGTLISATRFRTEEYRRQFHRLYMALRFNWLLVTLLKPLLSHRELVDELQRSAHEWIRNLQEPATLLKGKAAALAKLSISARSNMEHTLERLHHELVTTLDMTVRPLPKFMAGLLTDLRQARPAMSTGGGGGTLLPSSWISLMQTFVMETTRLPAKPKFEQLVEFLGKWVQTQANLGNVTPTDVPIAVVEYLEVIMRHTSSLQLFIVEYAVKLSGSAHRASVSLDQFTKTIKHYLLPLKLLLAMELRVLPLRQLLLAVDAIRFTKALFQLAKSWIVKMDPPANTMIKSSKFSLFLQQLDDETLADAVFTLGNFYGVMANQLLGAKAMVAVHYAYGGDIGRRVPGLFTLFASEQERRRSRQAAQMRHDEPDPSVQPPQKRPRTQCSFCRHVLVKDDYMVFATANLDHILLACQGCKERAVGVLALVDRT